MHVLLGLFLTALLAGCASAKAPAIDERGSDSFSTPTIERTGRLVTQAQRCMALAMYWEARGEGRNGMVAVGSVVLNRVEDGRFPNTVCDVVYEGGETPPCQFSWWCDGKSDRPRDRDSWHQALRIAGELLLDPPPDPTGGSLYFHASGVYPRWSRSLMRTARIGSHVFYR